MKDKHCDTCWHNGSCIGCPYLEDWEVKILEDSAELAIVEF